MNCRPAPPYWFDSDWIPQERVAIQYRGRPMMSVDSSGHGFRLVAYGENMVLLTDAISALYLLECNYWQRLKQTLLRYFEGPGFSFVLQRPIAPGWCFVRARFRRVEAMISRTEADPPSLITVQTYSARREERLRFSRPYIVNPFVLITRVQSGYEGLARLKGQRA